MTALRRPFRFPGTVYPIIDAAHSGRRSPLELAALVLGAGARLVQLRAKELSTRDLCTLARSLKALCDRSAARLIVNDRADVSLLVGAAGVHLGHTDLPPAEARCLLGSDALIGFSTHSLEQVRHANRLGCVDYLGFGPIFQTASKANPDPSQGIDGLRKARAATPLPIAAIGGITAATAPELLAAGADTVAMIGALAAAEDPGSIIRGIQS